MGHKRQNRASFTEIFRRLTKPICGHLGGILARCLRWVMANGYSPRYEADDVLDCGALSLKCDLCRRDYRMEGLRLCTVCGEAIARLARIADNEAQPASVGLTAREGNGTLARRVHPGQNAGDRLS